MEMKAAAGVLCFAGMRDWNKAGGHHSAKMRAARQYIKINWKF
jgi:hypothetical protein